MSEIFKKLQVGDEWAGLKYDGRHWITSNGAQVHGVIVSCGLVGSDEVSTLDFTPIPNKKIEMTAHGE